MDMSNSLSQTSMQLAANALQSGDTVVWVGQYYLSYQIELADGNDRMVVQQTRLTLSLVLDSRTSSPPFQPPKPQTHQPHPQQTR